VSLEPNQKVVPVQVITVKPRGPVWMKLQRRADAGKVSAAG
jgi:hypothetical protein